MKTMKIGILMIMLMVLVGSVTAVSGIIVSTDSVGEDDDIFQCGVDKVYARGTGFDTENSTTVDIYICKETGVGWADGDTILGRICIGDDKVKTITLSGTGTDGKFDATELWSPTCSDLGEYDIIADLDGEGDYDSDQDAIDQSSRIEGIAIVPESVIAVALIALLVPGMIYVVRRKSK